MIVCPECQRSNTDDTWFCAGCNAYLRWRGGQSPPAAADAAADPAPVRTVEGDDDLAVRTDVPWAIRLPPADVEQVRPVEPAEVRPPRVEAPPPAPVVRARGPRADETPCPNCGRPHQTDRRFCRHCGFELAALAPPAPLTLTPPPAREPWYRRLLRGGLSRDRRDFRQRMREAGKGARIRYSQALGLRATVFRALFVLATLGIGVSLVGPWGSARGWLSDQVARAFPRSYQVVTPAGLAVVPEQPELPGYLPLYAVDGQPSRAWAVGWDQAAERGAAEPCGQAPSVAAASLDVAFPAPVNLGRISVQAGLDRADGDWSKQGRPKTIDVVFSDGTCARLELADSFEPQHHEVEAAGVTAVRITVVDAYPHLDGDGALMALSEVAFAQRD